MVRYLLDTNILSDAVRNPAGVVAKKLSRFTRAERRNLCTSIMAAAELRFGVLNNDSPRLRNRVEEILRSIDVLPLKEDADRHYAQLRLHLERSGSPIGANDMSIAAHALSAGCILVSDNVREFNRVPGIRLENWLRPAR
jgi:tRNA(fMet)-specific endonuclease VapC